MVHTATLTAAAAAALLALPHGACAMYAKDSPVLQLSGKTYDRLVAQSNYTSVSGPERGVPELTV